MVGSNSDSSKVLVRYEAKQYADRLDQQLFWLSRQGWSDKWQAWIPVFSSSIWPRGWRTDAHRGAKVCVGSGDESDHDAEVDMSDFTCPGRRNLVPKWLALRPAALAGEPMEVNDDDEEVAATDSCPHDGAAAGVGVAELDLGGCPESRVD